MTSAKPKESAIQKRGIARMRRFGWQVHRRNTGAVVSSYKGRTRMVRFSEPGMSDTWGFTTRRWHFEAETKRPGERPDYNQVMWLTTNNGPITPCFWYDSMEVLEKVVRHIERGGRIEYLPTQRQYTHKGAKVWGPSGDYDLVF